MNKFLALAFLVFLVVVSAWSQEDISTKNIGTMIYVPEGSYHRDKGQDNINTISAFYMCSKEVTQEQFVAVTGLKNPSKNRKVANGPVESVTWFQALYFCNKLSILEGLAPVYSILGSTNPADWGKVPKKDDMNWRKAEANWEADGYRLPTAAEWEWAALGAEDRSIKLFSGSSVGSVQDLAWYQENSGNSIHPVATKLANELGLYDMSGNVYELCWAVSEDKKGPLRDPKGNPRPDVWKARCGGFFNSKLLMLDVSYETPISPYEFDQYTGFRVIRIVRGK